MPRLVISLPDAGEVIHELKAPHLTLGRVAGNAIVIEDPSVSSNHAELTLKGDAYELKDLGSTNGTRINGDPLEGGRVVTVRTGDRIEFGKVEAILESDKKKEAQPMPLEEAAIATPAAASQRPQDFSNASPFEGKKTARNPLDLVAIIATVLALLVGAAAAFSVSQLTPPQL